MNIICKKLESELIGKFKVILSEESYDCIDYIINDNILWTITDAIVDEIDDNEYIEDEINL
jgi:hypothetical protein